jgi:amino acid permease
MKSLWANLQFALYCASIIIGAGVLTMPLTGRLLGFVPLLAMTILIGLWLILIYRRMADILFTNVAEVAAERTDEVKDAVAEGMNISTDKQWRSFFHRRMISTEVQKGAALFDEVVHRTDIGNAGHAALLVGMFFYVFFADIGYIIIGNRSLNAVAVTLKEYGGPTASFGAFGVALIIASLGLPRFVRRPSARSGALQKFLMMAGWWCLAIGILNLIGDSDFVLGNASSGSILGSILFLIAILTTMFTGTGVTDDARKRDGLDTQHRVNVVVTIIELLLLLVTGVLIVGVFLKGGLTEKFYGFASGWLTPSRMSEWSRLIGVILFAYVGTGIFNLCSYPQLFEGNPSTKGKPRFDYVVALGTLIPLALYVGWTMVGAMTLSPQELALADASNEPTHIPIARKAASISQEGAWVITLTGYLFALMAVTSACNGFTESLADRIRITLQHSRRRHETRNDFRPIILLSAAAMALAKDVFSASIDISAILSIAGTAGGGLLILVLPFFFPYPLGRRTRARYWEIAVVLITAFVLVVGIALEPTEGPGATSQVITWIKWAVAAGVAVMTVWLLFSEPSE